MPSGLKLQVLRTLSDEFPQELSKVTYIPKAGDNLVATEEA